MSRMCPVFIAYLSLNFSPEIIKSLHSGSSFGFLTPKISEILSSEVFGVSWNERPGGFDSPAAT